jgi:hypothetical protein
MKTTEQEQFINDKSQSRAETLTDLPITDEQAQHTKGGAGDDAPTEEISFSYGRCPVQYFNKQ